MEIQKLALEKGSQNVTRFRASDGGLENNKV
jgi:hypothetical protein